MAHSHFFFRLSAKYLTPFIFGSFAAFSVYAAPTKQSVLEEVIVTAQKREQSTQDVSVAVSAFSGDAVKQMGFEEGLDITAQVPNIGFFAIFGEASSPSISLRGISLVNFSDSWESPVSIYVDEVYRGNPAGSAIQLFDIERVEVLRGPQGTLYGRNTTGGLVHYLSKKPTDELDAYVKGSVGSYSERILEGAVGGPLSEEFKARLALKMSQNDGWQTNVTTGEKLNDTDAYGYRAQLQYEPSDAFNVLLNLHGSKADQNSVGFAHMGYLEGSTAGSATCSISDIHKGLCTSETFPGLTGQGQVNGQYDPEHVASGAADGLKTDIETFGSSLSVEWTMGSRQFTSITAYETLDKFLQDDGDGTEIVWFDEQYFADATQITQEFRYSGEENFGKWVTGLYFYSDERDLNTQAPTTADASGGFFHQELVYLESESVALFGQLEYDFSPEWTAIVGARFTTEERDFEQDAGPSFYDELDVTDDLSDDAFTGRLGLDWRPQDNILGYASYSTGFKSGGFSGSYNASELATQPVGAEDISNLELGYKHTLAAGKVRINAAAFAYKVKDYQAQVFISVEEGSVITNAGDVKGQGLELEVNSLVGEHLELIAGLGLLKTEFDSQQQFTVAGEFYSLDGNELPSSPGLTYNLVARYYVPMNDAGELAFQIDYSWQDDQFLQIENDPYSKQEAYGLANAKISWVSDSGSWQAAVFAKNLADEEYFTYQNTLGSDWGYGVWGQPRTVGASVEWSM